MKWRANTRWGPPVDRTPTMISETVFLFLWQYSFISLFERDFASQHINQCVKRRTVKFDSLDDTQDLVIPGDFIAVDTCKSGYWHVLIYKQKIL